MELEWTNLALDDLEAIRDYIGKDSPHFSRRFIGCIFDAAEKLQDHPQIGRVVPEADGDDVRELNLPGLPSHLPDQAESCAGPHRHPRQPSPGGRRDEAVGCPLI